MTLSRLLPLWLLSLILCISAIVLIFNSYEKLETLRSGNVVEVSVIDVPVTCEESRRRNKAYFRFEYKNKIYTKKIKGKKYCETIVKNSTIKLKTNKDNSHFVYTDENIKTEIMAIVLLFLIGSVCLYKSLKNKILITTKTN